MENNFITLAYIISYPGIAFLAWAITQFAKALVDKWKPENKTRYLVLAIIVVLMTIRLIVFVNQLEVYTFMAFLTLIVEWLLNIPLIWLAVMKGHEQLVEKNTDN